MDLLENHRPGWYLASLLISFGYPFLIPAFGRRAAARPSLWFLSFAATSGLIAAGAWLVSARLTRFALTGGLP